MMNLLDKLSKLTFELSAALKSAGCADDDLKQVAIRLPARAFDLAMLDAERIGPFGTSNSDPRKAVSEARINGLRIVRATDPREAEAREARAREHGAPYDETLRTGTIIDDVIISDLLDGKYR